MKKTIKLTSLILILVLAISLLSACGNQTATTTTGTSTTVISSETQNTTAGGQTDDEILIAHLPKSIGGAWYTRMFAGFTRYSEENSNVKVVQIGASKADAALQNAAIEDFITQAQGKKAAICISFVSPEASEQVLKKAKEAGIVIIGNEGPKATNINYDVEAFENDSFGAAVAKELATMMNQDGKYAIMVGKLSSSTHMQWADAVQKRIAADYPNMVLVQNPYLEGNYDQQASYEKTKELIKTYPDIKGFFCTSATDSAGIARAIDETGLADSTSFVTLGTPDLYVDYVKSGAVDLITGWDPSMMGEAMCELAMKLIDGEKIENGLNLGVFGFDNVIIDGAVIKGNAWQRIEKSNIQEILDRDY